MRGMLRHERRLQLVDVIRVTLVAAAVLSMTAPAESAAAPCRIAVLGDSLAAGYGVRVSESFPPQLEEALRAEGYDCVVLNAGVSGDTSAGGLARLDWTLGDDPSHMIIELGGNDGLRGLPITQLRDNLAQILERLAQEDVPALLTGMLPPPNYGQDYFDEFAAVYPQLSERYDVPLYPFFLEGVAAEPELNQEDGIHPTAEGVEVIVENMLPTVTAWLDKTGVPAS